MAYNKILFLSILLLEPALLSTSFAQATSGNCGTRSGSGTDNDPYVYADNCQWRVENGTLTISGSGRMADFDHTDAKGAPWKGSSFTNVVIEGATRDAYGNITNTGITNIGSHAFYWRYDVTNISIPDSVTSIGSNALFIPGTTQQNFKLPESVSSIGGYGLRLNTPYLVIPESLTDIQYYSLKGSYTSVVIPDTVTQIGGDVFNGSATYYCASLDICANHGAANEKIKLYEKDKNTGLYTLYTLQDGEKIPLIDEETGKTYYYSSPETMAAGGFEQGCETKTACEGKAAQYINDKAEAMAGGALCGTKEGCLKLMNMAKDGTYCSTIAACKKYGDENGIAFGNYAIPSNGGGYALYDDNNNFLGFKGKRIYTVQEANQASAPTGNRVSIRYK